jgi:hypothetical protein
MEKQEDKLSYLDQKLFEAGIITVMRCPPGFFINWTSIIGFLLIVFTIVGLWWFTYSTATEAGYHRGLAEAERKELRDKLDNQAARISENERLLKMAVTPLEDESK